MKGNKCPGEFWVIEPLSNSSNNFLMTLDVVMTPTWLPERVTCARSCEQTLLLLLMPHPGLVSVFSIYENRLFHDVNCFFLFKNLIGQIIGQKNI